MDERRLVSFGNAWEQAVLLCDGDVDKALRLLKAAIELLMKGGK